MRKTTCVSLLFVLVGSLVLAADAPPPESVFPSIPQLPDPAPKVDPNVVPVLTPDVYYIVKNDAPFLLFSSPPGLVTISKETGPIRLRGKFIDGTGKVETRTIAAKNIAFVEVVPGAKGRVELIYLPVGTADESKATRRTVDVDAGTGPKPPDPKPPGPADPLLGVLQAAYDAEPATATKAVDKLALAATFRALATAITDPVVKDGDDNFALITNSIQASIDGRLKTKLRPTIGAEINKILPNGPGKGAVPLTVSNRADAAMLYLRIATLLDQVK